MLVSEKINKTWFIKLWAQAAHQISLDRLNRPIAVPA